MSRTCTFACTSRNPLRDMETKPFLLLVSRAGLEPATLCLKGMPVM